MVSSHDRLFYNTGNNYSRAIVPTLTLPTTNLSHREPSQSLHPGQTVGTARWLSALGKLLLQLLSLRESREGPRRQGLQQALQRSSPCRPSGRAV